MKNNLLKFLILFFVGASFLLVNSSEANAQRRSASKYTIDQTIRRVETNADRFVAAINDSLDRSRLEDTNAEDRINQRARALGDATDKLRREFDRGDSLQQNRQYVRNVLSIARNINTTMQRRNFGRNTEGVWAGLRRDLNSLARAYGLAGI
jgi:hypothetical protein